MRLRTALALLLPISLLGLAAAPAEAPPEPEWIFDLPLTGSLIEFGPSSEPEFTIHDEVRILRQRAWEAEEARRAQEVEDLKDRQARLQELGWYRGQVDGIVGPLTIAAREDFQATVGLEVNGEDVTDEFVEALFDPTAPAVPEPSPEPEPVPEPEPAPASASSEPTVATSGVPWDRIAQCESGGDWAINTGNGYHGGLQFDKSSWDWAGGPPGYPHEHSREVQIATAEKLLAIHPAGLGAWPACTKKLGLR